MLEGKHTDFVGNTYAQRVAAKGLMNLALGKKEVRHVILGKLSSRIDEMMGGKADQVVVSYLNALVRGSSIV